MERGIEFPVLNFFSLYTFFSLSQARIYKRAVYKLLLKNKRLHCTTYLHLCWTLWTYPISIYTGTPKANGKSVGVCVYVLYIRC